MDTWKDARISPPEKVKRVLCITKSGGYFDSIHDEGDFFDYHNNWRVEDVTHWMDLPAVPKWIRHE